MKAYSTIHVHIKQGKTNPSNLSTLLRENIERLLIYVLGPITDTTQISVPRPPCFHPRSKQNRVYLSAPKDIVKELSDKAKRGGNEVHCPLTRAWLGFFPAVTNLTKSLNDISFRMNRASNIDLLKHSKINPENQVGLNTNLTDTPTASKSV